MFSSYWKALEPEEKKQLADSCETSVAYLSQIANGERNPGRSLTATLEKLTGIHRRKLRPDLVEWMRA